MKKNARPEALRGIPCHVCGSKTSAASTDYVGRVVCDANLNGRDRCREREVANMFKETTR